MKHFLKGLFALLFALLIAVPAEAGFNLRQNEDGTTDWVRTDSKNVEDAIGVGEFYLTVRIDNIATAGTYAVTIPVTDVKVTYIQSVLLDALTGSTNTVLRFWNVQAGLTEASLAGNSTSKEISNTTSPMTIASTSASIPSTIFSFAVTGTVDTFTPTANNNMEKDSVIMINTDGGSTSLSVRDHAMITITLKKR